MNRLPFTPFTHRGFTLLELVIVVALVIVLFATAIENVLPLRGDAERAAVIATTGRLKSAIGLEATQRTLTRGAPSLEAMAGANPVAWLATPPANYAGTVATGDYGAVRPGAWAYDAAAGILFYRIRYPIYFEGSFAPPGIRYRVTVTRDAAGAIRGVELTQLDAAAWNVEGSEFGRWVGVTP